MIVRREGSGRDSPMPARPSSMPELSRLLRQARAARGLQLEEVSQRTGIDLERLEDLESGTVDRLPDRVEILQALSRYATFLQLPADQLVMSLVEAWPARATLAATAPVMAPPTEPSTTVMPSTTPGLPPTRAIPLTAPRRAPAGSAVHVPPTSLHGSTAQVPAVLADTGRTQAVRAGADDGPGMAFVRALVVVVLILVLVGTAWLVINDLRPQWLAELHLPTSPTSASNLSATSVPTHTAPAVHPPATTASSAPKAAVDHRPSVFPSMRLVSANASQATFAVTTSRFDVQISATGGEAWVQATGPLRTSPSYVGILHNGQSQVVPAYRQLVVRIGSVAAHIAVRARGKLLGTYVPPGAPFVMTFTTG